MADRDVKILLKTIADMTGANRLGQWMTKHSATVRSLSGAYKQLKTAAGAVGRLGAAGLRQLRTAALGAVAAIGAATREAVVFNVQMARAWTMMSGVGLQAFRAYRSEVIALSGDLGVAKDQLAGGLYQALSKGVPQDNVISFLRDAAKVAITDGADVVTMVDLMTTILNAFHLEAAQTTEVTDKLAKTVEIAGTTFGELGQHIAQAAPMADSMGVSLDEILAAIATLTKGGTPTAQAMTQIRNALLGVNKVLGDGWSKTMSFQEALVKVRGEAGESQQKLLKLVGTQEAMSGVLGLTGRNANQAASDLRDMGDAAGAMEEKFAKVQQFRHWSQALETVRGLVTKIGTVFDSVLKGPVEAITKRLAEWRDRDDLFEALEARLLKASETLQALWEMATDGGQAKEVAGAIGQLLMGYLIMGAEKAAGFLMSKAPLLGDAIGRAAKDAFAIGYDAQVQAAAEKYAAKEMGISPEEVRRRRLALEGKQAAANMPGVGGDIVSGAQATLQQLAAGGRARLAGPPRPAPTPPAAPPSSPPAAGPTGPSRADQEAQLEAALAQYPEALAAYRRERGEAGAASAAADQFRESGRLPGNTLKSPAGAAGRIQRQLDQMAEQAQFEADEANNALESLLQPIRKIAAAHGTQKSVTARIKALEEQMRNPPE